MAKTIRKPQPSTDKAISTLEELGHVPPRAIEFEEAVLGALMIEKDAYSLVSEILKPQSFYEIKHQKIYQAIQNLSIAQNPVDIITVTEELRKQGDLELVGGPFYITQLSSKVVSSANIEYHARIIAQKHLARELISYTSRIQTRAFDETIDVDDLMQDAEGELFEISQQNMKKDYTQINPVIDNAFELLRKAAARTDGLSGLETGFTQLDKITSGWQNSDLIIIAARPAMGKTAFVLSMAKNITVNYHQPVAIFSLEMANVQLVNRLISNVCEIPSEKLKSGQLAQYEWSQLDIKVKELYDAPLYLDDTPSLSIFELRTKARRLVREHGIKLIIIDYLHNRNNESREGIDGKRPQLSDLRESGAIEQDADIVCFIHRPEYYKIYEDENKNDMRGMAEFIIAKHRNGAVGHILLRFRGEYIKFTNRDDDAYMPSPSQGGEIVMESKSNNTDDIYPPANQSEIPF